jgi:predicted nucleic acid-binding protein
MKFVVDASVAVKWYVPEIYELEASGLLGGDHTFHAPELILPEISNIIWKKGLRSELTSAESKKIIIAFSRQNIRLHSHRQIIKSAFSGAEKTGQTVYDWTYLALAISLGCKFITADRKFHEAIKVTQLSDNILWIGDLR